jgi:hypothetical protein
LEKARNRREAEHQQKVAQWKAEDEAADANKASQLQALELRRATEEAVIVRHRTALSDALAAARLKEEQSYATFVLDDATKLQAADAALASAAPAAAAPVVAAAPPAATADAAAVAAAATMAQAQQEAAATAQRLQDSMMAAGVDMPQGVCLAALVLQAFTATQVAPNPPPPGPRSPRGNPAAPPAPEQSLLAFAASDSLAAQWEQLQALEVAQQHQHQQQAAVQQQQQLDAVRVQQELQEQLRLQQEGEQQQLLRKKTELQAAAAAEAASSAAAAAAATAAAPAAAAAKAPNTLMFGAGGGTVAAVATIPSPSGLQWPADKAAEYHVALMLSNKIHRDKVAADSQLALLPPTPEQPAADSGAGGSKARDRSHTPPPRRHADPELAAASREKLGLDE